MHINRIYLTLSYILLFTGAFTFLCDATMTLVEAAEIFRLITI